MSNLLLEISRARYEQTTAPPAGNRAQDAGDDHD